MLDLEVLYDLFDPAVHEDPYPVYEVASWPHRDVDLAAATRVRSGPVRGYASLPITWTGPPVDASEKVAR